ncbi:YdcF family protein [Clostridium oceanicum]|uniref:YdcF family protein n=1 Tax=Clostridium oceanicum TaxID=1543 RepID=A0ABN1JVN4_9CLOT
MFSKAVKSDSIVILGCKVYENTPSEFLKARLNRGLELYNKGFGDYIIVSGGKGEGDLKSEAKIMEEYLIKNGVEKNKIITEDKSINTWENIKYCDQIIKSNHFKSVVIVSNKYHLKRINMVCKKMKVNSSYSGVYLSSYKMEELLGVIREVVASFKYIILYMFK